MGHLGNGVCGPGAWRTIKREKPGSKANMTFWSCVSRGESTEPKAEAPLALAKGNTGKNFSG